MILPNSSPRCGLSRLLAVTALMSTCSALAQGDVKKEEQTKPVDLNEIVISAPKLSTKSLLEAPISATAVPRKTLQDAGMYTVKDAAMYAPNTYITEFSARAISTPRFRGIGGSPTNPGVTTYIDGVPQFNGNSSSIMLIDVEQIDMVRGPVGALYGRNTAGGLVNITSRRPTLQGWEGELQTMIGNYNLQDYRGRVSGALIEDVLGFSFMGGYNQRDGYTKNTVNGQPIDNRGSWFGKTQFLWTPTKQLEVRLIIAGETARDGDYALNDVAQLRATPRQSARDFGGFTKRDVLMPTLQVTWHGDSFDFTSTTGLVWWKTQDVTDLDYSTFNFIPGNTFLLRNNRQQQTTWSQEFRFSNPKNVPITLSDSAFLTWQAGAFFFDQTYQQTTAQNQDNVFFPVFIPANTTNTSAALHDQGMGLYAQSTLTAWKKLDITAGLRWDYEHKQADLSASRNPIAPPFLPSLDASSRTAKTYSQVTPQASIAYRFTPGLMAYAGFSGGYKAGGFNTASVTGRTNYDQERSWNYEIGLKGRALQDKLGFQLAAFYTDWRNLQLNTPNAASLATFDVINAGNAVSKGLELSANYQATSSWTVFGSAGLQTARFLSGSMDSGAAIGGNKVPYTPNYTAAVGSQYNWELSQGWTLYARGDVQFLGGFVYDSSNAAGQNAYTLANFRVGIRRQSWYSEFFLNNAFNTRYVPIAIPYPNPASAPSGYLGESGAPMTFGVRAGIKF
ncbi:MAG: TonB-dependent receptor [Verrucomicrobia bacterium]|nr:TonB-dependent receptor [Verrucomicrobiota bacterium]